PRSAPHRRGRVQGLRARLPSGRRPGRPGERRAVHEGRTLSMTSPSVVVLDYGSGNVHSAVKALERAGASVELSADRDRVMHADGLLVPGVGAFAAVVEALGRARGAELIERRLAGGRKVLG